VLSIVIPLFNEQDSLPLLLERLLPVAASIDPFYELIFVNDGSTDKTPHLLVSAARINSHVRILTFTRNFGHQAAVTAGLDCAAGDCVVVMDADLQDPPELLPQMVALYREGFDIVSPQRTSRIGDSWFKRASAKFFYKLMQKMVDRRVVPEVGDFRLFSRRAVHAICNFREQHRFMRGLIAWLGLKEAILPFERQPRAAGETKYPLHKMLRFSWVAITSFSGLPLRVALFTGLFFVALDVFLVFYILYVTLILKSVVPGWASIIIVQALFSGVTLVSLGLVGDYISRIYDESKRRPLYVVEESMNLSQEAVGSARGLFLDPKSAKAKSATANSI
jgi:glycosyltransferase involved in cell wall biosynthesis